LTVRKKIASGGSRLTPFLGWCPAASVAGDLD
jgi:hypothetical protein